MGWFVGRRLWLGTERSDLLAVGFYKLRRGVACLVLSIGECSICRGGGCLSMCVDFLGGFMCIGVRLRFVVRRLWLAALSGPICWR